MYPLRFAEKEIYASTLQCEDDNHYCLESEDNHNVRFYAPTSYSDSDLDVSTWGKSIASLHYATTHSNINDVIQYKNIIDHRRLKAREPNAGNCLIILARPCIKPRLALLEYHRFLPMKKEILIGWFSNVDKG